MTHMQEWHLRRASENNVEQLYLLLSIPEVYRYLADGTAAPRSKIEEWFENTRVENTDNILGLWILENNEEQIAGCVSLEMKDQPQTAELVYLLHPQFWGQGLATRMSWTIMQRAFQEGHVDQILAGADEPNIASIAVMRRVGMTFLRKVQYPLGPGVEYVRRHDDPAPIRFPATIPIIG